SSMRRCREIGVRWYGTAHQKGVIEGAGEFRRRLDEFAAVTENRDTALLAFLDAPRTVEEIAGHRLVYRPHVKGSHVDPVERRTAVRHLNRLIDTGLVTEVEKGRFRAT
ncbi:MBL fold metallo-hydrolase, partial [Streptomyces sp. SID2955]|nr:MBL fold metallo-hydrolase [Streptomyces sp. SID2955]